MAAASQEQSRHKYSHNPACLQRPYGTSATIHEGDERIRQQRERTFMLGEKKGEMEKQWRKQNKTKQKTWKSLRSMREDKEIRNEKEFYFQKLPEL